MPFKKQSTMFSQTKIQQEAEYITSLDVDNIYSAAYSAKTIRRFYRILQDYYQNSNRWQTSVSDSEDRTQKLHKIMIIAFYDLVEKNPNSNQLHATWKAYNQLVSQNAIFSALNQTEQTIYTKIENGYYEGTYSNHKRRAIGTSINKACVGYAAAGSSASAVGFFALTGGAYALYKAIHATDPVEMLADSMLFLALWGGGLAITMVGLLICSCALKASKGQYREAESQSSTSSRYQSL